MLPRGGETKYLKFLALSNEHRFRLSQLRGTILVCLDINSNFNASNFN